MADYFIFLRAIRDTLFPIECICCGVDGAYCCIICLNKIQIKNKVIECNSVLFFSGYTYANFFIRKMIHELKYQHYTSTHSSLVHLIERWALVSGHLIPENCILVPVPLHRKKLSKRGFNQAEILAEILGKTLDLPVEKKLLIRTIDTLSQTKAENRENNVLNVFKVFAETHENVFLVDDVITSGSTMKACVSALDDKNISCVGGFSLAWGSSTAPKQKNPGS